MLDMAIKLGVRSASALGSGKDNSEMASRVSHDKASSKAPDEVTEDVMDLVELLPDEEDEQDGQDGQANE